LSLLISSLGPVRFQNGDRRLGRGSKL